MSDLVVQPLLMSELTIPGLFVYIFSIRIVCIGDR